MQEAVNMLFLSELVSETLLPQRSEQASPKVMEFHNVSGSLLNRFLSASFFKEESSCRFANPGLKKEWGRMLLPQFCLLLSSPMRDAQGMVGECFSAGLAVLSTVNAQHGKARRIWQMGCFRQGVGLL